MNPAAHILVIDDDERLRVLLRKFLVDEGFVVSTACDAEDARVMMQWFVFDALILDVMMPGEDGVAFAHTLRTQQAPPILMLSALGEAEDRIRGLEAGIDDYLTKPFEPRELVLRLHALLRRGQAHGEDAISFGKYRFDRQAAQLLEDDAPVHLTNAEAQLLQALCATPGKVIAREKLSEVLGANARSVDVTVTRLRKKIEAEPSRPVHIQTIRGEGYVLKA